ncbi:TPA: class I tRNA ligase family protein, partial [bacterium]|nr:class I tRNA ligase family protein [bacterium]
GVLKHGKSPYKQLVSHGFVVDGKGAKMSKSVGNVVDPLQILETHGADILRLWVASIDYQADTKISDDILKQVSENYRKIRNTLKFLVGNLSNGSEEDRFDPSSDTVSEFELIDLYVLERLKEVSNTYLDHFDNYNFMGAFHTILNFITIELSSLYLDIAKDILYCETKESLRRRQVQSVIYKLLDTLIRLLTPFIPHTMDELYAHFDNSVISTALLDMPVRDSVDTELISDFKLLINLRDDVLKAIEEARNSEIVRSSQEASIELEIKDDKTKEVFDRLSDIEQNRFFIVSEVKQVNLDGLNKLSTAKVRVSYHTGEKCERCWNKFTSSEMVDNVCQRCNDAIEYYKEKLDEEE